MSDIDLAVRASRRLENILEARFGAKGRGLHSMISSVEHSIPKPLVRSLRWVATMRNKVVHDESFKLEDPAAFKAEAKRLEKELSRHARGRIPGRTKALVLLSVLFAVVAWALLG